MTLPETEGDIPMQRTETYQDTFLNQARNCLLYTSDAADE